MALWRLRQKDHQLTTQEDLATKINSAVSILANPVEDQCSFKATNNTHISQSASVNRHPGNMNYRGTKVNLLLKWKERSDNSIHNWTVLSLTLWSIFSYTEDIFIRSHKEREMLKVNRPKETSDILKTWINVFITHLQSETEWEKLLMNPQLF